MAEEWIVLGYKISKEGFEVDKRKIATIGKQPLLSLCEAYEIFLDMWVSIGGSYGISPR